MCCLVVYPDSPINIPVAAESQLEIPVSFIPIHKPSNVLGSKQSPKPSNKVQSPRVLDLRREISTLLRVLDEAQVVPKPGDGAPAHRDRPLECVVHLRIGACLVPDRSEQSMRRFDDRRSRVVQPVTSSARARGRERTYIKQPVP